MKGLMIAAPQSNSGKTTVALALGRALANRGQAVCGFKCGPDYIDTQYLRVATKGTAGNLDVHMMGEEGLAQSIGMHAAGYAVVEGVMGYFDGSGNTSYSSSHHIAELLDLPVVLTWAPKGEMFTLIPKLKGMVDFAEGRIVGIILNKVTEHYYRKIAPQITAYTGIEVLGYLPERQAYTVSNESLGLLDPSAIPAKEIFFDGLAEQLEKTVDVNRLIALMSSLETRPLSIANKGATIAIARDDAFRFYYHENDYLFHKVGEVVYFSPLRDGTLPKADLVVIDGGYPENYTDQLEQNSTMLEGIRAHCARGGKLLAMGGGLLYTSKTLDGVGMVDVFDIEATMTDNIQGFGYCYLKGRAASLLGSKDIVLKGKQFYKGALTTTMDPVFHVTRGEAIPVKPTGYQRQNALGMMAHLNFIGNMTSFTALFEEEKR